MNSKQEKNCLKERMVSPPVDITQTEKEFRVEMNVPGFDKDEISVRVNDDRLLIEGKSHADQYDQDLNYEIREWMKSDFTKEFRLSNEIERDSIDAKCKDGILTINLKTKHSTFQTININ